MSSEGGNVSIGAGRGVIGANVLARRLTAVLGLTGGRGGRMGLAWEVVPVYDLRVLGRARYQEEVTVAVSATGYKTMHTVPAGKRWVLLAMELIKASGDFTVQEIRLETRPGGLIRLEQFSATTGRSTLFEGQRLELEAGDKLALYVGAYTTTGNLASRVLALEEVVGEG